MARSLDTKSKEAIAAHIQFYRELGINSFYRRSDAPEVANDVVTAKPQHNSIASFKPGSTLPILDKSSTLAVIRDDIGDCTRCRLHSGRKNLVFGVGNLDADIMFVGEGPGAD